MNSRKQLIEKWKTDYDFKTVASAFGSLAVTVIFALYNGFLGVYHASLWHGSICLYYLILIVLRWVLIAAGKKAVPACKREDSIKRVYLKASVLLLLLNASMIVPITLMIRLQKPVSLTLIPAISSAVYTTYKVTLASINLKKRKKASNSLLRLLRTINFIDALVSILTLQNTLIMISSEGKDIGMLPFTIVTSTIIWAALLILSVIAVIKGVIGLRSGR
ncbi:MAG: hypothetical protein II879_04655 [Clostridia bacterium]|nr:hypothetical protein [Clostridia bacterium]